MRACVRACFYCVFCSFCSSVVVPVFQCPFSFLLPCICYFFLRWFCFCFCAFVYVCVCVCVCVCMRACFYRACISDRVRNCFCVFLFASFSYCICVCFEFVRERILVCVYIVFLLVCVCEFVCFFGR